MSRRRKKSTLAVLVEVFGTLLYFFILLCMAIIKCIIKLFAFLFAMIGFHKTQYKTKSGNGFFKTYFNKGFWGEYQLYKRLIKVFGEDKLLTNIYLPSINTDNTEIDVLGVHNGIVYCYEMKNYNGTIYGKQTDKYWTQVLAFRIKHKFFNPLRQNYAHTQSLKEYLGINEVEIVPIVVFNNNANLSNITVSNSRILKLNSDFHLNINDSGSLTDEEIIKRLSERTNVDEIIKEEHINQVNELKSDL